MKRVADGKIPVNEWTSRSTNETFDVGLRVGQHLAGGEILLLDGPLGAGKTIFVKGIASALGIDPDNVTSPSFTLVNVYDGALRIYHLDLYRLSDGPSAAHAVDFDELLTDSDAIIVVEWADRMRGYRLPLSTWQVYLSGDGEDSRAIKIMPHPAGKPADWT